MGDAPEKADGEKATAASRASTSSGEQGEDDIHFAPIQTAKTQGSYRSPELERRATEIFNSIPEEERAQLKRLATFHRTKTEGTIVSPAGTNLERKDTIAGVEFDDPRLDPESPQFDIYIWARVFIRALDEDGIKRTKAGYCFKNLSVSGSGSALSIQKNVGSILMALFRPKEFFSFGSQPHKQILKNFNGVVKSGELLVVLGRPGSGCSTFLKTVCGELSGLNLDEGSDIHYNGISQKEVLEHYKGEVIYNQEVDKHFPHLTVGETLEFAAAARTPQTRPKGTTRAEHIDHMVAVTMAVFGLSHTRNTKVGNDFIRGVSGGERKRVSIAEMALAGSPLACWDNSTRGLDAATALEFVRTLRLISDLGDGVHSVAIYQASQAIYDLFDKAIVLYEGRQIFFGPATEARAYFQDMGWFCPSRQTTGDFLTSVTNPQERKPREGFETKVPRTPDEFVTYWLQSPNYAQLQEEIKEYETALGDNPVDEFKEHHQMMQAKGVSKKSAFVISVPMMIRLCGKRAYQRIMNDKTSTIATIFSQIVMALIIGSIFYGTPSTTGAFFAKGSVLFFAVLLNALISINEIVALYEQRPIVEKQKSYAMYHPWTEALAGVVTDIPVKFMIAVAFNIILYFLSGLKTTASAFFTFFLINFIATLTMSSIFRTLAASTKTVAQAMSFAGVMVLAIVIYTGFTLPRPYMHPWMKWLSWCNPVSYAFEALLVNEVHKVRYQCASPVPPPPFQSGSSFVCPVAGAVIGEDSVSGDAWVSASYGYSYSHIWRNLGILFAFQFFFLFIYLVATEVNSSTASTAEKLVFRRGHAPLSVTSAAERKDEEAISDPVSSDSDTAKGDKVNALPPQKDIFTWRNVVYDISIKGEPRRLLDHVSGWVKPGTLTALMGVSGAGKTTLLDALAQRTTTGVITGDMFVNGKPLDSGFQRKTGYVQQQDLHLETTTVREALQFSASLRQPKSVPRAEKLAFVEEVIDMLNMRDFAEAIVGVPGEGLNVEQRKLLTIGVELAAKPALLLFLDEPTSGLDSQSSWAIVAFMRKLADRGQAVLSTIHQPSAILFQEFDRLLFLAKGGKTVYFGDVGPNSRVLLDYFEAHGARQCGDAENPAEYMLEMVGAGATGKSSQDWSAVWKESEETKAVQAELDRIHAEKKGETIAGGEGKEAQQEFAMPLYAQLYECLKRVFQQYWRSPSYVYGKLLLGIMSALFIGFSFYKQNASQQGIQNQVFSIFMLVAILSTLVQQIMPLFVVQRSLYEVRERPSKAYSWIAFVVANIFVEIPWQILLGILAWASYYFPTFGKHQASERQGLILLLCIQFFIFASTFAHFIIAAMPDAETAGAVVTLLFSLSLTFNGVLQTPTALPGFWIFMYRVSPLTYLVDAIAAAGISGRAISCASNELAKFAAPSGTTCGDYLGRYAQAAGGVILNPDSRDLCEYCPLRSTDQFLANVGITWSHRWRDYGLGWAYIAFNIFAAVFLYWAFRVKRWSPKSLTAMPNKLIHYAKQGASIARVPLVGHNKELARTGTEQERKGKGNKVF